MMKNIKIKIIMIIIVVFVSLGLIVTLDLISKQKEYSGDIEIVHELGTTKVSKNPKKIVVFDYAILETLDALEIDVIGIPKANVPSHLSKYTAKEIYDVGTLFEPNFELLYSLEPDLIIIGGRQKSLYAQFQEVGPTIYIGFDNANFFDSFENNLILLSKIFTNENRFENYLQEVKAEIEEVNKIASNSNLNAIVLMVSGSTVSALGIGSRYDVVYSDFGVKVADPNLEISTHGVEVTFEYIYELNPDIIFVIDRDLITEKSESAKKLLNNAFVNKTKAAKNNRIIYLSPNQWYLTTGGYYSIKVMINEVKSAYN